MVMTGLVWGLFMGVSTNLRYQLRRPPGRSRLGSPCGCPLHVRVLQPAGPGAASPRPGAHGAHPVAALCVCVSSNLRCQVRRPRGHARRGLTLWLQSASGKGAAAAPCRAAHSHLGAAAELGDPSLVPAVDGKQGSHDRTPSHLGRSHMACRYTQ
jgi:hypothetical protein